MTIDTLDHSFATFSAGLVKTSYARPDLRYGMAASCKTDYGSFKIDTIGTGMIINSSVSSVHWRFEGYSPASDVFGRRNG